MTQLSHTFVAMLHGPVVAGSGVVIQHRVGVVSACFYHPGHLMMYTIGCGGHLGVVERTMNNGVRI
jgi:hypothetical protein